MTDKERYDALLLGLAELLEKKNGEISLLRWQLETVEGKLAEATASLEKGATQV